MLEDTARGHTSWEIAKRMKVGKRQEGARTTTEGHRSSGRPPNPGHLPPRTQTVSDTPTGAHRPRGLGCRGLREHPAPSYRVSGVAAPSAVGRSGSRWHRPRHARALTFTRSLLFSSTFRSSLETMYSCLFFPSVVRVNKFILGNEGSRA